MKDIIVRFDSHLQAAVKAFFKCSSPAIAIAAARAIRAFVGATIPRVVALRFDPLPVQYQSPIRDWAQNALGYDSEAVHQAYAAGAVALCPPLDEYEEKIVPLTAAMMRQKSRPERFTSVA